jgi:hypothetical protein
MLGSGDQSAKHLKNSTGEKMTIEKFIEIISPKMSDADAKKFGPFVQAYAVPFALLRALYHITNYLEGRIAEVVANRPL